MRTQNFYSLPGQILFVSQAVGLSLPTIVHPRRALLLSGVGLILGLVAAYHNSFTGPFVFDDIPAIVDNPSIRRLSPLSAVLSPRLDDAGVTVSGRPLVNLSLAVSYALGAKTVVGYHVLNLLIHALGGLVLFAVTRRTLQQPVFAKRFDAVALPLALAIAALWTLHPLQTEVVTYIVQRAESLMALCYLLTLYGFIRGTTSATPSSGWLVLSFTACLAGMACKEVMVSAPLMVFLYDRTFVAGSFREAWTRRKVYYLGLAATWLLLAWLVAGTMGRGGTAGFGNEISAWNYLLMQTYAIGHYLRLALWPDPLVFDYGTAIKSLAEVWPQALGLVMLTGGVGWALKRRPVLGFLGVWFFALLAPSSSFVPVVSQTMAEHRIYLALAAPVALAVAGLYTWLGHRSFYVCSALVLASIALTIHRNEAYRSDLTLWTDTVAKLPNNPRAQNNLGKAAFALGRIEDSIGYYREAIRLKAAAPEPHYNLGLALTRLGRPQEAIPEYEEALRIKPEYPEAENNLGNAFLEAGNLTAALAHYERAANFRPAFAEARSNLANVLLELGRGSEAILRGEEAVRLDPEYADARYNLGNALAQGGQLAAALIQYEAALRLKPDFADAANNAANVYVELGRLPDAIAYYEQALRIRPNNFDARRNLAMVLIHLDRGSEALMHLRELVRLRPDDAKARADLARLQDQIRP